MKQKYYTTPKMVKNYLLSISKSRQNLPIFTDALLEMKESGLLCTEPLQIPEIDGAMSKNDFISAFDQQPIDVNWVIDDLSVEHNENQRIAFNDNADIACSQHMHHPGFIRQTLSNVFSLTYIFQGNCTVSFGNKLLTLNPGEIFITSPGFDYYLHTSADAFAIIVVVKSSTFEILFHDFLSSNQKFADFFRSSIPDSSGNFCVIHGKADDDLLRMYIQSLACEYINKDNLYYNSCSISLLKLFLANAFRRYSESIEFYEQNFSENNSGSEDIYKYIISNYRDITLKKLADHFHYNSTYISRFIHSAFRKPFSEILLEIKINYAKDYLKKTNYTISEIASITGFNSLNHFSKTFKKHTGMTPKEYRNH